MMPINEPSLVAAQEGAVQVELDILVLERLLRERGITLDEVRFLNPSSQRAGWTALKQALVCGRN